MVLMNLIYIGKNSERPLGQIYTKCAKREHTWNTSESLLMYPCTSPSSLHIEQGTLLRLPFFACRITSYSRSREEREFCWYYWVCRLLALSTVSHHILLKRLSVQYGVTGTVADWIQSCTTTRSQSVRISGSYSEPAVLKLCYATVIGAWNWVFL